MSDSQMMPEYRHDPLSGRWVIIAPDRSRRPLGLSHARPHTRRDAERESCPFCAGREVNTPSESFRIPAGDSSWAVRVVPNKYPAVEPNAQPCDSGSALYQTIVGQGWHEVVVETPRHETNPARLSVIEFTHVLTAYRQRIEELSKLPNVESVTIFKNVGAEAGASLAHLHSQIVTMPRVPESQLLELSRCAKHHAEHGRCLLCDIVTMECQLNVRLIRQTDHFVAICPFASRFAYEMMILPKQHMSRFTEMDAGLSRELAGLMLQLFGKLDSVLDYPAYNFYLHDTPVANTDTASTHWHIKLFPKTSHAAGFEWATDCFINAVRPENAAADLRVAKSI